MAQSNGDAEADHMVSCLQDRVDDKLCLDAAAEITILRVQLEAARKTLEPFAEIAKELTDQLTDDRKNTMHWAVPTVGQFREALRIYIVLTPFP